MNQEEKFNKRRLRSSYANVVISISLMLYLCGVLMFFVFNTNKIIDRLRESIGITVILKDNIKDSDLQVFLKEIYLKPYTKHVKYTSKEDAALEMAEDLGESFVDFIGYNPLPSSFELQVFSDYSNSDSLEVIYKDLIKVKFIDSISAQYDMIDNLNKTKTRLSAILLVLTAILLVIIITIINSTIKLSIYSNRHLIKTMQMIGATSTFIRRPYLSRSVVQGMLGATISIILMSVTIYLFTGYYSDMEVLLSISQIILIILVTYFLGICVSFFTSLFAVNKYLNIRTKILY
ncbi:permease-like cell division protein FtsX [Bacteroidales bacterium OttesenSCG-928-K03]|nr:permease-like cell division protein FtsX [Odoribacter sp. OttesenSCG-928-L07]MDL2239005.1 permease-like cell division protein FtsX [Bacteroidales bacterium OttesenSCG-928-L14]MDL2240707.1 permease-like cell division protein FtsX [Bacteroidales bacterium OttesenSCG-928-K22]MDL2242157.1 permease-like cell division protein FtsX [Bacteroidales bacterium OttesenSCG-928-K03]